MMFRISHYPIATVLTTHYIVFMKEFIFWASMQENLSSGVCEQHRRRPACASAQSDQRLCYSFFEKYHINLLQVKFQFSS